ncbi:Lipase [Lachnellula suecica]|uniref:Carboxylic ester hydrolase n=1 Tax=Lachnellula suecica TaxID=602035 RepID=A0A8T9CDL4_9HELO|nr:Lipase [Lachnellula suecica]
MFINYFPEKLLRFVILLAYISGLVSAFDITEVDTPVGKIHGTIINNTPLVTQFLGIPFAQPPLGPLRWLPPKPKSPVASINATTFGPSCPQYWTSLPQVYNTDVPGFLVYGPTSEDCLTLNIWAPSGSRFKLPVIVWLYGGSFQTGGGSVLYQIPSQWVERSQGHIVVGINYRLNIFGFPNAAGLNSNELNLGLLDQRFGLEWIRANIGFFGGDPSRIILWGQSAGAMSADYYDFAYFHDPIISGLILDSGTALLPLGTDDPTHSNFTFMATYFGCGPTFSPKAELDCMRNVSSYDLELFLDAYQDDFTQPMITFYPVVDNRTKFENYTKRALAGNFARIPAIIGTNADEAASLLPWDPLLGPTPTNVAILTQSNFLCLASQTTKNRYHANVPTWRYLYAGNFTNLSPRPWEGAYHASELPMIFGTAGAASTSFQNATSAKMQDLWLAFARDPYRGLLLQGWAPYMPNGTAAQFGQLGSGGNLVDTIGIDALEAPCAFGTTPI